MSKGRYTVSVDPKVWDLVERSAKNAGTSTSYWVECALIWDLVSDGNAEAMKMAAGRIMVNMRKRLARLGVVSEA